MSAGGFVPDARTEPSGWRVSVAPPLDCAVVTSSVDQGEADSFLENQLKPELLEAACAAANIPLTLRRQPGYDHSYYFIASFIEDHLRWHHSRLTESA